MKFVFGTALKNREPLILEITELHIIINVNRFKCKGAVIFVRL